MSTQVNLDRTEKITISIPASLLATVDELVKEHKSSRSNKMIVEILSKAAQERFEAEIREICLENAEEAQEIAEEFSHLRLKSGRSGKLKIKNSLSL